MKTLEFSEKFKKLEDFLKLKNWKIMKTNEHSGICDFSKKTIFYNSKLLNKHKIYVILHECGHKIIEENKKSKYFKYGQVLDSRFDKRKKKSNLFRLEVLREEFEAWEVGWDLSVHLDLGLNMKDYKKFMAKQIYTYCQWAVSKDWEWEEN